MKKLLLFLPFIMSPVCSMEDVGEALPTGTGWHVTNNTGAPVALGWYKTKVTRNPMYRSAWGPKEEISRAKIIIPDQETLFIPRPPEQSPSGWFNSSLRRELLMSYSPSLLLPRIDADSAGKIQDMLGLSIVVASLADLPSTKEFEPGSFTLIKPLGSTAIKVISEALPRQEVYWALENKHKEPVYCAWYEASWDYEKKAYRNPKIMDRQIIVTIAPHELVALPFPQTQSTAHVQRQLLISYDKDQLRSSVPHDEENNLPTGIIARTQYDLQPYQSQWLIYSEHGEPYLVPFGNLLRVINTTNNPLYAAMYFKNSSGAVKFGPRNFITEILPQLSVHIPYPKTVNRGDKVTLVVTTEQDKELLYEAELSHAELSRVCQKGFTSTNLINWYFEGAYAILPDIKRPSPYNFRVSSVGGGLLGRLPRGTLEISGFDPSQIDTLESRFRENDPLFVANEFIVEAIHEKDSKVIEDLSDLYTEKNFTDMRLESARKAINTLVGSEIIRPGQKIPKIALVFTGGGYRAMTETIGFLRGAEKTGIFDCATYMTGLSGSTWAINPLVASGLLPSEFSAQQREKVTKGVHTLGSLYQLILNVIKDPSYIQRRFIQSRFGQSHGIIGLYGHALANALLDGFMVNGKISPHDITLSDLRTNLYDNGKPKYPLPLSIAVDPGIDPNGSERVWYEFSPFYIGTKQERGSWVDSMLFGSTFREGKIDHFVPEYPLAQFMGIWGSAFALTADDVYKNTAAGGYLISSIASLGSAAGSVYNFLLSKEEAPSDCPGRAVYGQVPNMSYQGSKASCLQDKAFLCLIDGGITKQTDYRHNFSTIPALWRDVDVLIMCDSHGDPATDDKSEHLIGASEEAYSLGLNFPMLHRGRLRQKTLKKIANEISTLIMEENKPIVVYMKGKKIDEYADQNEYIPDFDPDQTVSGFTKAVNFNYTKKQFDALSGLTEHIMSHPETVGNIKEAIETAVRRINK